MQVIISGAGHGGLVAGARLARVGHDVTILEKKERTALGYDWEDRFTFDLLLKAVEKTELPNDIWTYRGDCDFISPSYRKRVTINYTDENRQKVMWRKPLIDMLIDYAEKCEVKFIYGITVKSAITEGDRVLGVETDKGEYLADLVIDSAGVFSPVRMSLPDSLNIKKSPSRGDVFYAYRAYYNNNEPETEHSVPFEIYLYHDKEQGLSWLNTTKDSVDMLIGRIDPLNDDLLNRHIAKFRGTHKWIGEDIINAGQRCVIPVSKPLCLMVANGYAAVGDSAFMTTPMNGMGIDLSILAGTLLADTVIDSNSASITDLWKYNRDFHRLYGGDTAKNEGLKNALLSMSGEGVDFLFENDIIQSSDLAGAGSNTSLPTLLGKLVRGMKNPPHFFAVLNGLIKGGKVSKVYKKAPEEYDYNAVLEWQNKIEASALKITNGGE